MTDDGSPARGAMMLFEMQEFARFPAATQRYIRRSIDIALMRSGGRGSRARNKQEDVCCRVQAMHYERLPHIRALIPEDDMADWLEPFFAPLVTISAFDLGQGRIQRFGAYRFLYERIIGPSVRPWLLSAFSAAASLPSITPQLRRDLLNSIPEAAATAPGWSLREPSFVPDWIELDENEERSALN